MKFLRTSEAKVILSLVLLLAFMEIGARVFEVNLSKDVKHIRSLPAVAARLKQAPKERLKVLILGNSLSRDGLDQPLLKDGLARLTGREVELAAMYPDASSISQWYYGYRRYFDQTDSAPDIVLIGTGRPHLLDGFSEPDRLAAFYTSIVDMPRLLQEQSGDVEAISKALLARSSMLFAHRARVQPLTFYNLIPGYTETTQTIGVKRDAALPAVPALVAQTAESCQMLADLLQTLRAKHSQAIIVTIPMTENYALPACIMTTAEAQATPVIADGAAMHFDAVHFPDGYHLDKSGGAEFTRRLLDRIAQTPGCLPGTAPLSPK